MGESTTGTASGAVTEPIVQRGRYAAELAPGQVYAHRPGRTLTEADNVAFTTLTMNTQALHLDHAFAATQSFGRPLMNSMLTLSTMVGQSVGQLTQGTLVAQLGLGEISFPAPVFHGDTLTTSTEVVSVRESSSRPGQCIVVFAHTGVNQEGTVVARAQRTCLLWAAAEHAGSETPAATTTDPGA